MDSNAELVSDSDADVEIEVNPLVHLIAPVAAIFGTLIVRKVVNTVYERSTGHKAPDARDRNTSLTQALVWTASITTSAAVAEGALYRIVHRVGQRRG